MRQRAVRILLVVVTLVGLAFLFGFPVRTLLQQGHQMSVARMQQRDLAAENAKLAQRAAQLQTSGEIEQIARQEYGLVMPGDHAYVVLPPQAPVTTTTTAPRVPVREHSR